jgi:alkanesulfonate monooxygenase SsuD/methylene tetrahydromethanopterin reductase-like flavin-dependent oxidoreductase (luciferase family)
VTLDVTDDEARALAKHLRQALDYDPDPLAPRLDPLKAILAKLEPQTARAVICGTTR